MHVKRTAGAWGKCTIRFFIAMEKVDMGLIYVDHNEDCSCRQYNYVAMHIAKSY